jgi:hypothetical protein
MRITLPPVVTELTLDAVSVALTTDLSLAANSLTTAGATDRNDIISMDSGSTKAGSVDIGLIVGCVIGGLACLIAMILVVFFVAKRRQKQKNETQSTDNGIAMAPPPRPVYGTAPRVANVNQEERAMVGSYRSADMNTNYMGFNKVASAASANGQYVDMQMGGNSTGSFSMPASEEYTTGHLEN